MSRTLPDRPNLEHLKKQAKARLSEIRLEHPDAQLADAQLAVAREYGFAHWPALKARVDALSASPTNGAGAQGNPFVGRWTANIAKSRRHPANLFQRATIEFAVAGDAVTITDVVVDEAGREEGRTNSLHVDGIERPVEHGCTLTASWRGTRALEVVVNKGAEVVGRASYRVSADGQVLTTSDLHGEQVIVLDRVRAG
jgi:hypothetical protein